MQLDAVADPGGQGGHGSLGSVKISHQKIAAEGGRIDFMFLAPLPIRPLDPLLGCAENLIVSSFQFFYLNFLFNVI